MTEGIIPTAFKKYQNDYRLTEFGKQMLEQLQQEIVAEIKKNAETPYKAAIGNEGLIHTPQPDKKTISLKLLLGTESEAVNK